MIRLRNTRGEELRVSDKAAADRWRARGYSDVPEEKPARKSTRSQAAEKSDEK